MTRRESQKFRSIFPALSAVALTAFLAAPVAAAGLGDTMGGAMKDQARGAAVDAVAPPAVAAPAAVPADGAAPAPAAAPADSMGGMMNAGKVGAGTAAQAAAGGAGMKAAGTQGGKAALGEAMKPAAAPAAAPAAEAPAAEPEN